MPNHSSVARETVVEQLEHSEQSEGASVGLKGVDFQQKPGEYPPKVRLWMPKEGLAHFDIFTPDMGTKLSQNDIQFAWKGKYPILSPGDFDDIGLETNETWPPKVAMKVVFRDPPQHALGAVLLIGRLYFPDEGTGFVLCGVDPTVQKTSTGSFVTFSYWLESTSRVLVRVSRTEDQSQVYSAQPTTSKPGLHRVEWSAAGQQQGYYFARIDVTELQGSGPGITIAMLFAIKD